MIQFSIILFILGLCVGSFLNVLIDRIPAGKSVLFGRSQCDFCKKQLAWYDLIPVVSYLFLQGKCRYCLKQLSAQYPLVELTTGLLFVGIFFFDHSFLIIDLMLASICLALTIMDIKYHILSDKLLIAGTVLVFLRFIFGQYILLLPHLGVGLLASLPLFLLFLLTKGKGMGFGDVKLIGIIGFFVGFPLILVVYYAAFLLGGIIGICFVLTGKKKFSQAIAFGPFLLLGMVIAIIWGKQFVDYLLLTIYH